MELATRIREAIMALHTDIENLPFSKAMIGGTVERATYLELLVNLHHIHEVLETNLDHLRANTAYGRVYQPVMARLGTLERDLAALNANHAELPAPREEATRLTGMLEELATDKPWAALGALYVLEGSRMGSMALVRPVARAMGVAVEANTGVDYHFDGMQTRPRVWGQFKAEFNSLPLNGQQQEEIVEAAVETMRTLNDLYAALSSVEMVSV